MSLQPLGRWPRVAMRGARHPIVHARAVAAAIGAAFHVRNVVGEQPIDRAIAQLREGRPFSGTLRDPQLHARVVRVLLPALPPRNTGECLKRSLILLHLWSRCGLEPRLHLGCHPPATSTLQAHAWLTTPGGPYIGPATPANGYQELFVF